MQLGAKPELGEGVDFAAAGATDLNNFKGYHNQEANKNEEEERYIHPETGAHFDFNDVCRRLVKMLQIKGQEKKILTLTGNEEHLDPCYYEADPDFKMPANYQMKKRSSAMHLPNGKQIQLPSMPF
jgi:hypothetical protein